MNDRVEHVLGSGFIIDNSGLILTNSHLVFGRQLIEVTLDDGTTEPAQLIGADPILDVALLKVAKPSNVALTGSRLVGMLSRRPSLPRHCLAHSSLNSFQ